MNKSTYIWIQIFTAVTLVGAGVAVGTALKPEGLGKFWQAVAFYEPAHEDKDDHEDEAVDDHGSGMVELSETAIKNMKLTVGRPKVRDYFKNIEIPATVVERLPAGRRSITAPIAGTVSNVFVSPGQAIRAGNPLFELTVTDDQISEAQVRLLNLMAEIVIADKQLNRIKPMAEDGTVKGSRLLDAEFEVTKLKTNYDAVCQELLLRGLTQSQLEDLIRNKNLVQKLMIYAPKLPDSETLDESTQWYTAEQIDALTGTNLQRGEPLCTLTFHGQLFIEGYAYESDLEKLTRSNIETISITAEFGESTEPYLRDGLRLHSINNHVDAESQTYPLYVTIGNEIQSERTDDQNRTFVSWRFKPGQRAHLMFPIETWADQIVFPIDAIAEEGPEVFVFRKIPHTHEVDGEIFQEFKRVSVQLAYKDKDYAIIDPASRLDTDATYATSKAYDLNLALKRAASGGGGHSHPHPH